MASSICLLLFALGASANIGHHFGQGIPKAFEAQQVVYLDGSGDSLSVAYNAVVNGLPSTTTGESSCPNGDMSGRSWAAELASTVCPVSSSPALVHSFAEQLFCDSSPTLKVANHAEIGRAVQQECRDRSRMPSSA
eukprot:TRINITY_DN10942_c0_g1_i1.p1 TRINITY_DN10942_c0_g1~~TRINITY_DN10942_c0_g1_i1.p1  ORF type:complete len:136 (-),score=8.75 TRINITY_DN10942_c0_g1_i1:11-418(-)